MCCSRWINAAQGIRTRTREVTAPPLMGGAVVQGGVSCLLDFRSANFGDLWGMGARKNPKLRMKFAFGGWKRTFLGPWPTAGEVVHFPVVLLTTPATPPLRKALAAARISSRCCAGAGEVELRWWRSRSLWQRGLNMEELSKKTDVFFKSCLEVFFKTIRDQSVNIYWTVQTHWSTIPTGFAGGGLPRSTALRSRRLRRDLPGTIWDAGRVSEKTIQWFGAERFGAMVGPTWPNKTQPGSQLELPIEFPNHKIVYRNMQKQLWYG